MHRTHKRLFSRSKASLSLLAAAKTMRFSSRQGVAWVGSCDRLPMPVPKSFTPTEEEGDATSPNVGDRGELSVSESDTPEAGDAPMVFCQ